MFTDCASPSDKFDLHEFPACLSQFSLNKAFSPKSSGGVALETNTERVQPQSQKFSLILLVESSTAAKATK